MLHFSSHCVIFSILAVSVTVGQKQENHNLEDNRLRCHYVQPSTTDRTVVYNDWPFQLSCAELAASSGIALNSPTSECFVSSDSLARQSANERITLSATSPLLEIFTVTQVISQSRCYSTNVTVERRLLPSRSCYDDVKYFVDRNVNVIHKTMQFGREMLLECIPGPNAGNEAIFPPSVPSSDYTTTWWRTRRFENSSLDANNACLDYSARARTTYLLEQTSNTDRPDSITKYSANFFDGAIYSCQVEYNGQTAFISHYSVCVENTIHETTPVVMCNEVIHAFKGECVEIQCSVLTSNKKIKSGQLEVEWMKLEGEDSYACKTSYLSVPNKARNSKTTCTVKDFHNQGTKCFNYVPTDKELSKYQDLNTFKIRYILRNFQQADAGRYRVHLKYEDTWSEPQYINVRFERATTINQHFRRLLNLVKNQVPGCMEAET